MLDGRYLRENLDAVRDAMGARAGDWDFDRFIALDDERRGLIAEVESRQAVRNDLSRRIGELMKSGQRDEAEDAKERVRAVNEEIAEIDARRTGVEAEVREMLLTIPNIPHESVPTGADESDNVEVRRWGTPPAFEFEPVAHWDLGPDLGAIDFERGVKLAKSRFVVLGRDGARLNRALINFMLDTHGARGYREWSVPAMANSETLLGTGQLPKFADDLFHTDEGLYLIPTAEVQLTNLHRDEVLEAADLPLRYCAYTPCFREEAGAAGRDTRGMIRVHQFDKVELVKFARPEEPSTGE